MMNNFIGSSKGAYQYSIHLLHWGMKFALPSILASFFFYPAKLCDGAVRLALVGYWLCTSDHELVLISIWIPYGVKPRYCTGTLCSTIVLYEQEVCTVLRHYAWKSFSFRVPPPPTPCPAGTLGAFRLEGATHRRLGESRRRRIFSCIIKMSPAAIRSPSYHLPTFLWLYSSFSLSSFSQLSTPFRVTTP